MVTSFRSCSDLLLLTISLLPSFFLYFPTPGQMTGEAVGKCLFTVCGPKCSLCCLALSIWGVVMLVSGGGGGCAVRAVVELYSMSSCTGHVQAVRDP